MAKTKVCKGCGENKPLDAYSPGANGKPRGRCKQCGVIAATLWKDSNPRKALDYHLRRTFGITIEHYDAMLEEQGGVCAICGQPPIVTKPTRVRKHEWMPEAPAVAPRLIVDHDHDTGEVRGLLCKPCNTGIGMLADSAERCRRAAEYLGGAPSGT